MNLHRTTGKPDWENISASKRSAIQRVAAATKGIITPPNIISLIGLGLVIYGVIALLNQEFWTGLIFLTVGRLLDIVDGAVAEATGTKSAVGEFVDASIDKIGTLLTIAVFFIAAIADWWLIALLLLPQVIIPLVIFYKRSKKVSVHPTRQGKLSMAGAWGGLVGLILIRALETTWPHPLAVIVYGIVIVSAALGLYALWQYTTGRD